MENNNFSSGLAGDEPGYNESLEYLYSRLPMFSRIGAAAYKPGLETSLKLSAAFGDPHRKFRSIHVAGTNGKGSISHTLASVLQASGLKVGLYTSPHLVDFRERIRVNGKMIPRRKVIDFVDRWREMDYDGSPSFFELTMMMAFEWFSAEKVDVAVIEVGMGGRLDSTNIITPELCVITNISKDHTQFLGSTPEAIAWEKAGIIKQGIPVVIGEASGIVKEVFEKRAAEVGAPIRFAEDEKAPLRILAPAEPSGWIAESPLAGKEPFRYPLGGDYQKKNLLTALTAIEEIEKRKLWPLDIRSVRKGLEEVEILTGLAGRWMVQGVTPLVICDTGHNEAGLRYNLAQLRRLLESRPGGKLRMVIGFVADKAIDDILAMMPRDAEYYLTNARIPRALPVSELGRKVAEIGLTAREYTDVVEGGRAALSEADQNDIVYIGGSTFVVADWLASRH